MKILAIILGVISIIDSFIFYCCVVVGKRADERMRAFFGESEEGGNDIHL